MLKGTEQWDVFMKRPSSFIIFYFWPLFIKIFYHGGHGLIPRSSWVQLRTVVTCQYELVRAMAMWSGGGIYNYFPTMVISCLGILEILLGHPTIITGWPDPFKWSVLVTDGPKWVPEGGYSRKWGFAAQSCQSSGYILEPKASQGFGQDCTCIVSLDHRSQHSLWFTAELHFWNEVKRVLLEENKGWI